MIDHVSIQVTDLAASRAFYERLLAPLGVSVQMDFGNVLGLGTPEFPFFWLGPPEDQLGPVGRGIHLAFTAPDRETVRAVHRAAVDEGIEVLHGRGSSPSTTRATTASSSAISTATTWRPSAISPRADAGATRSPARPGSRGRGPPRRRAP